MIEYDKENDMWVYTARFSNELMNEMAGVQPLDAREQLIEHITSLFADDLDQILEDKRNKK